MNEHRDSIANKQKYAKNKQRVQAQLNCTVRLVVFQNYFVLIRLLFVLFYIREGVYTVRFRRWIGDAV